MKVSEWLQDQPNLFDELHKLDSSLDFIEEFTPQTVQMLYEIKHSDRTVSSKMVDKTTTELAQMIHLLFSQSWTKVLREFDKNYELGEDVTRESSSENHSEAMNEHTSDAIAKTSPFNSTEQFVDTGGTENQTKNESSDTTTQTSTDTTKSLNAVHDYRTLFQDLVLTDVVFFDINNLLTLKIY